MIFVISIGLYLLANYYHSQFLNPPAIDYFLNFFMGLPSSHGMTTTLLVVEWFSKSLRLIPLSALLTQFPHFPPQAYSIQLHGLSISQGCTTTWHWMLMMCCTYQRCAHMLSGSSSSITQGLPTRDSFRSQSELLRNGWRVGRFTVWFPAWSSWFDICLFPDYRHYLS